MCEQGSKTRGQVGRVRRGWCGEVCGHGMKTLGWGGPSGEGPQGLAWTLSLEVLVGKEAAAAPDHTKHGRARSRGHRAFWVSEVTSPRNPKATETGMTTCF